jgi:hypothetical protein
MKFKLATLAATAVLGGCAIGGADVSGSFGTMGGAVSSVSPVLTVLSVAQTAHGILTSGESEYQVKVRSVDQNQSRAVRQALEEACHATFGSTVASAQASSDGRLTQDEVISYSGCYVERYEILERDRLVNGEVVVTVAATVRGNKLSNRLLGESVHDQPFSGEQHAGRISTYQQNMQESDRLVDAVLRDFPQRAYDIEIAKIRTQVKPNRTGYVRIDYLVNVNDNYLSSLKNLFGVVAKVPAGKIMGAYPVGKWGVSNPVAEVVVPGFMSQTIYQFNDQITYNKIQQGLNRPQQLAIYTKTGGKYSHLNDGDWRIFNCVPAVWNHNNSMLNFGSRGGRIRTNKVWYTVDLNFNNQGELDFLSNITDLKFEVISGQCPKFD